VVNKVFFNHKNECNYAIGRKPDETENIHAKWNNPEWETQDKYYIFSFICGM
jgi:hypothetical protein